MPDIIPAAAPKDTNAGQRGFFTVLTDGLTGALSKGIETLAEAEAMKLAGVQYVVTAPNTSSALVSPEADAAARAAARGTTPDSPLAGINPAWIIGGFVALGAIVLIGGAALALRK